MYKKNYSGTKLYFSILFSEFDINAEIHFNAYLIRISTYHKIISNATTQMIYKTYSSFDLMNCIN